MMVLQMFSDSVQKSRKLIQNKNKTQTQNEEWAGWWGWWEGETHHMNIEWRQGEVLVWALGVHCTITID